LIKFKVVEELDETGSDCSERRSDPEKPTTLY
jgi:hypothetical protein